MIIHVDADRNTPMIYLAGIDFRISIYYDNGVPSSVRFIPEPNIGSVPHIKLPDIIVVRMADGVDTMLYRSWYGAHMGHSRENGYIQPNGQPTLSFWPMAWAFRGDRNLNQNQLGGLELGDMLELWFEKYPDFEPPPWALKVFLVAQVTASDAVKYLPEEWEEGLLEPGFEKVLIWAVSLAQAQAIFDTLYRTCIDAERGQIDWSVVSPLVERK